MNSKRPEVPGSDPTSESKAKSSVEFISEFVHSLKLKVPPANPCKADPDDTITLGDLHGSFINFLWKLIKEGIIEFKENAKYEDESLKAVYAQYKNINAAYAQLLQIYNTPPDKLTEDHIELFFGMLDACLTVKPVKLLRLMGDIFSDRGRND